MNRRITITDTDLFERRGFPSDEYQLVYGTIYHTQCNRSYEESLYNLVASLCNRYQDCPLLREVKVDKWIVALDGARKQLLQIQDKNKSGGISTLIYIPYFQCGEPIGIQRLIDAFDLMIKYFKAIQKGKQNGEMVLYNPQHFIFPIKDENTLLIELAEHYHVKCQEWDEIWDNIEKEKDEERRSYYYELYDGVWPSEYYKDVWAGVMWELRRRNAGEDYFLELEHTGRSADSVCSDDNEYFYYEYFMHLKKVARESKDFDEEKEIKEIENVKEMSAKRRTGILRYMLESYGVKDKEKARRIIHFALYHGHKAFKIKTDSNDTVYSYLHNDKQLFKLAGDIKSVLKEYDVPIPEGLEELDKRVFE